MNRRLVLLNDVANYAFMFAGLYEISGCLADEAASADVDYDQMEKVGRFLGMQDLFFEREDFFTYGDINLI